MITEKLPYSNFHDLNLDWIIAKIKEVQSNLDFVIEHSTIKYADPIGWDITRQYEANTIVVDNRTGNAYISSKPVPAGIAINRTDYWSIIFNYSQDIVKLQKQIAAANEGSSTTATAARSVGTLVFVYDKLYRVTSPMVAGDTYVDGGNCEHITIEELFAELQDDINTNSNAIAAEITARENADTALGGRIDDEATARENADTALGGRIDDEATARENADNSLSSRITNLERERNVIIVGDSYGDEWGGKHFFPYYMQHALKLDDDHFHNLCVSGGGFIGNGTTEYFFITQIQNFTGNKNDITDIVVAGGLNDSYSGDLSDPFYTQVINKMSEFATYAEEYYPNAKLWLGYIGNGIDGSTLLGYKTFNARMACREIYYDNGVSLGFRILPFTDIILCGNKAFMDVDGTHPSELYGHVVLGRGLAQSIIGTLPDNIIQPTSVGTLNNVIFSSGDLSGLKFKNNRNIGEISADILHCYGVGTDIPNSFKFADLTSLYFNDPLNIECTVLLRGFNNLQDAYYNASLNFDGNSIILTIRATDGGSEITTFTGTGTLFICTFTSEFNIIKTA